jgi:hypothetical protein
MENGSNEPTHKGAPVLGRESVDGSLLAVLYGYFAADLRRSTAIPPSTVERCVITKKAPKWRYLASAEPKS